MFHSLLPRTASSWDSLNSLSAPDFTDVKANSVLFYLLSLISAIVVFDTIKCNNVQGQEWKIMNLSRLVCLHKTSYNLCL